MTNAGEIQNLAWAGGLDAPQVNRIDLTGDGIEEIVTFDRTSFTISVFEQIDGALSYAPSLAEVFPEDISHWMLLRDFNGDGKKDLFTSNPLGMVVYVNISDDDGIRWRLYHSRSPGPSPLMTTGFNGTINLQVNATDIPEIGDLDGDGDLDILVFRFTGTSTVEWHKNMAVERSGSLDSMQFVRETQKWGNFEECDCGQFAFAGETCPPASGKVLHEGGKSLLVLDWDGDGFKDPLISEESCFDLYRLANENGEMVTITDTFSENIPFPAAYFEDMDNDGINDLVVGSNIGSSSIISMDFSATLRYYQNSGSNELPEFVSMATPTLQNRMIDVGSGATPAFADVDNDGDMDLLISGRYTFYDETPRAAIQYFENTGDNNQPVFNFRENDFLNLSSLELHNMQIQFRDLDRDGDRDLIFLADDTNDNRRLYVIEAENGAWNATPYVLFDEFFPFDTFSLNYANDDSILDLIITRVSGRAELYLGDLVEGSLQLRLETLDLLGITNNPLQSRGRLILLDINQNGIPDAIYTYGRGEIFQSMDVDITKAAEFQPVQFEELSRSPSFGSYLWLEQVPLFTNEGGTSLMAGTGRGGLHLFRASFQPIQESDFIVYPNPVIKSESAFLTIRSDRPLQVYIVNMLGQEVRAFDNIPVGTHSISLETLKPGVYIVVGKEGGKTSITRRIVVLE